LAFGAIFLSRNDLNFR